MITRQEKNLLAICGFLIICLFVSFFSTTLQGSEKCYEVRPEITLPESKTDVTRLMDAYERLMDNYLKLMENNLTGIRTDIDDVTKKMDSIDRKISELSVKLDAVQKKLGIEPPEKPQKKTAGSGE